MRTINIVLDLYSAVISLLMIAYLVSRKRRKDQLRRSFILMCVLNFCTILGDLTNWTCEGFGQPWYPAALWSGSLLFWLCSLLSLVAFTYYIIAYLRPGVSVHRAFWHAVLILYTGHAACCLLSLWNGMFFTITVENIYQRGTFFWLSQSIAFVIYGINVAIFIVYRKSLSSVDFRILSSYIVMPMLSQAIQMCYYGLALLNTGITNGPLIFRNQRTVCPCFATVVMLFWDTEDTPSDKVHCLTLFLYGGRDTTMGYVRNIIIKADNMPGVTEEVKESLSVLLSLAETRANLFVVRGRSR